MAAPSTTTQNYALRAALFLNNRARHCLHTISMSSASLSTSLYGALYRILVTIGREILHGHSQMLSEDEKP